MTLQKVLISAVLLTGTMFTHSAFAADFEAASTCNFNGLLEGYSLYNQTSYPNAAAGAATMRTNISASGVGAVDYNCGTVNYQAIFDATNFFPYQYDSGGQGYDYSGISGSVEADIFLRDPQDYVLGLGVQVHGGDTHLKGFGAFNGRDFHNTSKFIEGLAFGEVYFDQLTLGAEAYIDMGEQDYGFTSTTASIQSVGGAAYARYYFNPNFRITARGFMDQSNNQTTNNMTNSYEGSLGVAYKMADTPFTVFTKGFYGGSNSTLASSFNPLSYVTGEVGFSLALGPHANGSLLELDRNGVVFH